MSTRREPHTGSSVAASLRQTVVIRGRPLCFRHTLTLFV